MQQDREEADKRAERRKAELEGQALFLGVPKSCEGLFPLSLWTVV